MTDTDPEKATIGDLFRLMTEANKKLDVQATELERLDGRVEKLTGEVRAAKRDLGLQIDALGGQQSGVQRQLGGMGDHVAALTSVVNGQTAQFRGINEKLDKMDDRLDRLERMPVR